MGCCSSKEIQMPKTEFAVPKWVTDIIQPGGSIKPVDQPNIPSELPPRRVRFSNRVKVVEWR